MYRKSINYILDMDTSGGERKRQMQCQWENYFHTSLLIVLFRSMFCVLVNTLFRDSFNFSNSLPKAFLLLTRKSLQEKTL